MGPRPNAASRKAIRERVAAQRADREARGWQFHDELRIDGKLPLTLGRLFRAQGRRGWFQFREARTLPDGRIEVHAFGPYRQDGSINERQLGAGAFRAFWAKDVSRVGRKTRGAQEERVEQINDERLAA